MSIFNLPITTQRVLDFESFHAVELTQQEKEADFLLVFLEVLRFPGIIYVNKEYNPDRGMYGRITESFTARPNFVQSATSSQEFVMSDRLIQYPQTLIYKGYRDTQVLLRGQAGIAADLEPSFREAILELPTDWPEIARYLTSLIIGALVDEISGRAFIEPPFHCPDVWRVTGPEGALYRWTIYSSTPAGTALPDDDDGGGGGGDGIIDRPPIDTPPGLPLLPDSPAAGSDPSSFFTPPATDPGVEFPIGEEGDVFRVTFTERWTTNRTNPASGPPQDGTFVYESEFVANNVPGPILSIGPLELESGGTNDITNSSVIIQTGSGPRFPVFIVASTEETVPINPDMANAAQRNLVVVDLQVEQIV